MSYQELGWATTYSFPLLAALQLLPLMLAVLITLIGKTRLVFPVAVIGSVGVLLLAILLYLGFDQSSTAFQYAEQIKLFGFINYHVAADGISILFVLLTTFLAFVIILYGRARSLGPAGHFITLCFVLEATLISQFVTVDLLWFVMASVIQLILVGYLLRRWPTTPGSDIAYSRYLPFMAIASVLLLAATTMLGWNASDVGAGHWSFDLSELINIPVRSEYQSVILLLFLFGFGLRIPVFPLHGWLPTTLEHGTVSVVAVFLIGIKTGLYALVRFVFPLMSETIIQWYQTIVVVAVIGIFYAAVLALVQQNLRRMLAYAVVSHSGLMMVGLFSLGHEAFQGAVLLAINFGLAIVVLLFMTGFVYSRTHTAKLHKLGGLFDHLPVIGTAFLVGGLSIIGMPGTPGFDAAHLVLEASIERFGAFVSIAAALGNVAAAGFLLWAFQRAFLAQSEYEAAPIVRPATVLERTIAVILITVLLVAGFYSTPWLDLIDKSFDAVSALYDIAH